MLKRLSGSLYFDHYHYHYYYYYYYYYYYHYYDNKTLFIDLKK